MGRNYRQGRLGEEIKKCISGYLLNGIKDPRLSARIITISAVEVSSDGSYATVYFTPLTLSDEDSREVAKEVLTAFNSAKGLFRTKISHDIKLRHAPELHPWNTADISMRLLMDSTNRKVIKMTNNTYLEIADNLLKSEKILIFPHENMDGDCLGSAAALCQMMRNSGKEAYVVADGKTPRNLDFLESGTLTSNKDVFNEYDLAVLVDCGSRSRIGDRAAVFDRGRVKAVIDHHGVSEQDTAFDFGVIEPSSAATAELVYLIAKEMGVEITLPIARCVFAAINTDTGSFQHSNTTARTHVIVSELYDIDGFDGNEITQLLYNRQSLGSIQLEGRVISGMKVCAGGKLAIGAVTRQLLDETDTDMSESEGIGQKLMSIDGVEIGCILKETDANTVRVSLRAKSYANVARVAQSYGGGGHVRAAGFTFEGTVDEAVVDVSRALEAELDRANDEK